VDVTTAYLDSTLNEQEVYLRIPDGMEFDWSKFVLQLRKSIYGLKISGKYWLVTLKKVLEKMSYQQSSLEQCLFYKKTNDSISILIIYVDDFCLVSNSLTIIEEMIQELES